MVHPDPFESDEVVDELLGDGSLSESLVGTLLREDALDPSLDWTRFSAEVMARLDEDEASRAAPAAPDRVLRVDGVDAEEAADAALVEGLPPRWTALLRARSTRELAEVEARFSGFPREVLGRLDGEPEGEARASLGEILQADVRAELDRREGDWTAFAAQLDARLEREDRAERDLPLEVRAVAALRRNVDRELIEMAPRFEASFRASVEARVLEATPPSLTWWGRMERFLRRGFSLEGGGLGLAAAAVAAVLLIVWGTSTTVVRPEETIDALAGSVRVEEVSFEGSVAVLPQAGVTVVFLSEAPEV